MQPTPVSLPGESHGQRSLAGYSPWGCRIGQGRSDLACRHRVYNCFWTFHKMQTCCCLKLCRFASKCDQFANLLLADSLILIFHAPRIPGSLSSPRLAVTSPILSAALHLQIEALLPPSLRLSRSLTRTDTKSFWSGHRSTGHTRSQLWDLLHLTLPALKLYLWWHPHSYPRCWVLLPRPQVRSSEPRSRLKLTSEADPLHLLPNMPDHYKLPNPQLGKDAHSRKHSIVPQPINHLTPTFQREFSLSWGFKTWLLTQENCRLSLVCWEVVSLLAVPMWSLLFVLNKLTPFWNALYLEILFQPALGLPQHQASSHSPQTHCHFLCG